LGLEETEKYIPFVFFFKKKKRQSYCFLVTGNLSKEEILFYVFNNEYELIVQKEN